MKLSYYTYYILHDGRRYLHSILPLLHNFVQIEHRGFRNSFQNNSGDFIYLLQSPSMVNNHVFLFILTRDHELIKAIDEDTFNQVEIYDRLQADEHLGFASYLYIEDMFFGIASTILGPRVTYLEKFVNDLLSRLVRGHSFHPSPIPSYKTRQEAISLPYKGKIHIQIDRDHPLFGNLCQIAGTMGNDTEIILIEFKPARRRQMSDTFDSLLRNLSEDGLRKFVVRAKEDLDDKATDFYITGAGYLSNQLNETQELGICGEIEEVIRNNIYLHQHLEQVRIDDGYINNESEELARYRDIGIWNGYLLDNSMVNS